MHELPGIAEAAHEHYRQALHRLGSLPEALSVERFIATVRQTGPVTDYKYYSPTARAMVADLSSIVGAGGARRFLKAAISGALADSIASEAFRQLPERVRSQQTAQFQRMALDPDLEADWLDIDSDLFHKEMGMATLRLYVAGAQLVDYHCGVPRSIILKEGRARAPQKLMAFVRDGGFKPFFQIHTHTFNLKAFNEEGWNECYRCCAELYALHPEVLGMFGSSWFYDPALDEVSPRLAYLRTVPLSGGARLLFDHVGGDANANSLSTSPTRKQLFDEGKYLPKNYMLVWPKHGQIEWAEKNPAPVSP